MKIGIALLFCFAMFLEIAARAPLVSDREP